MKCPYCSSIDIVYDFERGYAVCGKCGTIIDTIFIEQFIGIACESTKYAVKSVKNAIKFKKTHSYTQRLYEYLKEVNKYEIFMRRCRKNVNVNIDAIKIVLSGGKARIYKHVGDDELMRIVKNDYVIRKIMEMIDEDAILSSRTFRSKVAIALLIKNLLIYGEADLNEIAQKTNVSRVHIQRLTKILKTRIKELRPRLTEIKKLLNSMIPIPS
jgi:transcription initiation factor TFIIIB Brf1 subunit/transcription initiation factor TFIIB